MGVIFQAMYMLCMLILLPTIIDIKYGICRLSRFLRKIRRI